MHPPRASFRTFGCKLNQLETEAVADAFARAGFELAEFPGPAELCVFNTCTVTGKAEQKARREIRLALREAPEAVVIVTGCYAELEAAALAGLGPRTVVLPGGAKAALIPLAAALHEAAVDGRDLLGEAREAAAAASGRPVDPFAFEPSDSVFRSRAALKVEDGCDNACAYCRVHLARGPARGLEPAEAVSRARRLAERGLSEIVLTGVNLSQYRAGGLDFPGLLGLLLAETDGVAFRISSYEPDKVDERFAEVFSRPRVRPHLHLAVQSGSAGTLARMGRGYGPADVSRAAALARAARDDPFLAADLILGFPGETDGEFRETMGLLEELSLAWIHAFTFSARPGTPASSMPSKVPERTAVARAGLVADLARRSKAAYARRWIGRVVEAAAEGTLDGPVAGEPTIAVTENYLKVAVSGPVPAAGRGFRCVLEPLGGWAGRGLDLGARVLGPELSLSI